MFRETIDFGIDLGTTNSSIAYLRGAETEIIKYNGNEEVTPSVVCFDRKNEKHTGSFAKSRLIVDPENAAAEFKLLMGTTVETIFKRNGRRFKPEELSAEILKSLRANVRQMTGEEIEAAVITVPAAFDLPQCKATEAAARLAGLNVSPLLQEPIAAAMAYGFQHEGRKGFWLVYDLGGGTFDAAVIQVRDGMIQVINHGGDNQLGGKLIDWRIINELILPKITKEYSLSEFNRGNKRWYAAFAKLKQHAEEAKIGLSRNSSFEILIDHLCQDDNGESVQVDIDLTRDDIASLAMPFIIRSITICKKVLAEKRLGTGDIEKVLLVGGPTLAPYLREMLEDSKEGLGIPLDFSIDPLTVVSRGAAIFAGTQRLKTIAANPRVIGHYTVDLEYDPIGPDIDPLVSGKVLGVSGLNLEGFNIEFVNSESRPPWRSGKIALEPDGVFLANLWAEKGRKNTFSIELFDPTGRKVSIVPEQLSYTVGTTIAEQILPHSIGVAEANGNFYRYLEKGVPLPMKKRDDAFRTTITIKKGDPDSEIVIPVVEGENLKADRNHVIGRLIIPGTEFNRDIPAGTQVEITISMDQSRLLTATAYVPMTDQEFGLDKFVGSQHLPQPEELQDEVSRQLDRLYEIGEKNEQLGNAEVDQILSQIRQEQIVRDIEESLLAASADANAASTCQNRLKDLQSLLDRAEDVLHWPSLVAEAEDSLENTKQVVQNFGEANEKRLFEALNLETRRAIEAKEQDQLRLKISALNILYFRVSERQPEFWQRMLEWLEEQRDSMTDPSKSSQLFARAQQASLDNDIQALENSVKQIFTLLPETARQEAEAKAFGSTIIRG